MLAIPVQHGLEKGLQSGYWKGSNLSFALGHDFGSRLGRPAEGHLGGEPEMVSPRFELVGAQDPPKGFRRNGLDNAIGFELASQFRAIPLGERATSVVRSFTGQFHGAEGHFR